MLACWVEDPNGDAFKKHLARVPDYLWVSEDGMAMQVRVCVIITNGIYSLINLLACFTFFTIDVSF